MGRHHRSRSYSPRRSPPPSSSRRRYEEPRPRRHEDPRDRRSNRRSPPPSGLLVRNISLDARPEDLRIPFERFGPVKDVYLPKNYYTGEPRGFGFVKFRNPDDAAEAKRELNHCVIGGREIAIVFAEENRKTPREMRTTSQPRSSGRHGGDSGTRRTPPRSSRRRSYSRSLSPARRDFSDRGRKEYSRSSVSPPHEDDRRHKSRRSSPGENGRGSMHTDQRGGSHDKLPPPALEWKSNEDPPAAGGRLSRSRSRSPPYYDRGQKEYSRSSVSPLHEDDRRHKSRRSSPERNDMGSRHTDQRGSSHDKLQPPALDWKSNEDASVGGGAGAGAGGRLSRSRSMSRSPPPY